MVLWGVSPVKARMSTLSSLQVRQASMMATPTSSSWSASSLSRRTADTGQFRMPILTAGNRGWRSSTA